MRKVTLPDFNSRAVFVGKTGTGKTTLAERVCANFLNVVVLDSKAEMQWNGYQIFDNLSSVKRATATRIIWQPNPHEQNEESYDDFFKWVYDRKNTVCYIDEVLAICKNSQNIPFWYRALLTRGRSRGIGTFNSTQAPVYVPHWILSQSEHYFIFKMKLGTDREKVESITGISRYELDNLQNHEFYYANDNDYVRRKLKLKV
jgi:hypothetical protein